VIRLIRMKLFNSLTRKIEEVSCGEESPIGVYTCGPTVYSTATIGNFRTYVLSDIVVRSLRYLGHQVRYVMNLTDVGHLTGDNEGDSSQGDDRLEKAAKKEGKTAWEVSAEYASEFVRHMKALNLEIPEVLCKATDHIKEQIELVQRLEKKGYVYRIADGMYFDTRKYESMGNKYGELSTLDELNTGGRLEPNPEKRDKRDFALWKFSDREEKRHMEWESPWGVGFPGWHIECSAMSMKYLGEQFAIHVGGEDLRSTHHPNEIAQSEGATGKKPFVKTWVHGAFLLVDGGRMGKSLGNAYTVNEITGRGYDPLALRYFYLTGHYRKQLNFTWEALAAAGAALTKLRRIYQSTREEEGRTMLSEEKLTKIREYGADFRGRIEDDLDIPGAIAVVWEVAKSNIPGRDKAEMLADFDQVLGLGVETTPFKSQKEATEEIKKLLALRANLRSEGKWEEADKLRDQVRQRGYEVEDSPTNSGKGGT